MTARLEAIEALVEKQPLLWHNADKPSRTDIKVVALFLISEEELMHTIQRLSATSTVLHLCPS